MQCTSWWCWPTWPKVAQGGLFVVVLVIAQRTVQYLAMRTITTQRYASLLLINITPRSGTPAGA
eukprot:4275838-Pyramimonas_sp.AAC.1